MNRRHDYYFRLKPAAPKDKQSRPGKAFTTRVLRAANPAGGMRLRTLSTKPRATLARLGRGAAASAFGGPKRGPHLRAPASVTLAAHPDTSQPRAAEPPL